MAAKGINVFAVTPNSKRPLGGQSWFLRQSTEPETIAQFFEQTPNCNYGLHLGAEYVVIDLDRKPAHDGVKAFDEICRENGVDDFTLELDTLMAKTPGGGFHLYFRSPFPCANKNHFPDGIDVRGVTGFVVGPGSRDSRGEWELIDPDAEIMELPEWLEAYVVQPGYKDPNRDTPLIDLDLEENVEHAKAWLADRDPAIEGANGDDWTYETCQYVRDFGISEKKALEVLKDWNSRCKPAWGRAELEAKIANAYEYGQNRPGCKAPTYKAQRVVLGHGQGLWAAHLTEEARAEMFRPTSHLKVVVDNTKEDDDIPDDVADDEIDPVTGEDRGDFPWADFNDCMNIPTVRDYVIQRWLLDHSITHMIAARGTGKSTLALHMGCCIASDTPWAGQKIMPGWKVVYICGEDIVGMRLNQRAWCQHYGIEIPRGRFYVAMEAISLLDDTRLNMRIRDMMKWADGSRCVVILDTWQRSTSGWSKNDMEAMETAIERAEKIARHLRGPLISLVHPPKDGRMTVKGAGEQEDTSAGIYHVDERNDGVRMKIDRMKGPGKGKYMDFDLKTIEMEERDAFGEPLTGVVAVKIGGSEDENTIEAAERHDRELRAWAGVVRGLGIFTNEDNEYEPMKTLDIATVSKAVALLAAHAQENKADVLERLDARSFKERYLDELLPFFKNDLSRMSESKVQKRLTELFKRNNPPTVVCDNGKQVMEFVPKNPESKAPNPQRKFIFKEKQNIE